MKAIIYQRYGSPDVLECQDIETPAPRDDEVLIKVHAASVNPVDWHFMRGDPFLLRIGTGLRKPKNTRFGTDVAGRVEAAGRNVTRLKPGDEVFGVARGAVAESVCASESELAIKPPRVTFEQAASAGVAAFTALQGLRDKGHVQRGQKVLVNGASGGVGTFAVQIAKSFGAEVTGVCSTRNVDLVRSLGADRVIDYTREDFTQGWQRYDVIFDCAGNHSFFACRRVLNPKGVHVGVGGPRDQTVTGILAGSIAALVFSWFVSQKFVVFIARSNKDDFTALAELMESGNVTPVIDRRYTLHEAPDAVRYLEEGHARGKVVITVR